MYTIVSKKTGKMVYATHVSLDRKAVRQLTSSDKCVMYNDLRSAAYDFQNRQCSECYEIVAIKPLICRELTAKEQTELEKWRSIY